MASYKYGLEIKILNKTHGLILGVGLFFTGLFWFWDDTPIQLAELRQAKASQTQILQQWKQYQEACRHHSPLITFFEQNQKAPLWSRAKIKQAIDLFLEAYDLGLREFLVIESGQNNDAGEPKYHHIQLTIRASHDRDLFAFIEHLSHTMRPWVKISHVTLQRCGTIDESVLKEVRNGHRIDIVEARFELEWLLNLDRDGHTVDQ